MVCAFIVVSKYILALNLYFYFRVSYSICILYYDGTGTLVWSMKVRLDSYTFTPVTAGGVVSILVFNNGTNTTQFTGYSGSQMGLMLYNITVES